MEYTTGHAPLPRGGAADATSGAQPEEETMPLPALARAVAAHTGRLDCHAIHAEANRKVVATGE